MSSKLSPWNASKSIRIFEKDLSVHDGLLNVAWFCVCRFLAEEISCFLAVVRCPYESCRVLLHTCMMRYPDEMSL